MKKINRFRTMLLSAIVSLGSIACTGIEPETGNPEDSEKPLPLTLDVSVSEVTENTAYVNIETSHDESTYYASVIAKADYNRLGDDKALLDEDKEFFKYLARKEGKSYEQVIDFMLNTGSQEERFINLISDTEYYAYAYEMNADGEVTGGITKAEFRTEKQPGEPITFQMRMEEYRDKYAAVYVTPSTDTAWCVTGFIPEASVAQYGGSIQAIKLFAMEYLLSQSEFLGVEVGDIVDIFCSRGEFLFEDSKLVPETSYYAYVVAVNRYGKPISDVEALQFTTAKEGMIGFDIEINILGEVGGAVDAEFVTSDGKNKYVYMKYPSDLVESFESDEELQDWIIEDYGYSIRYWLVNGTQKTRYDNMLSGSDYYAIAFGYSEETEAPTTPIFKKKFTAPIADMSFEVSVELVKMGALITVFPGENYTQYACGLVDKMEYDAYGGSLENWFKDQVEKNKQDNPDYTVEQAILSKTYSGQEFITREYLYSNTQYYFWAAAVNRDCEFVGEPKIEEFTSKEHVLNDDYVTVSTYLYDGAELAEQSFLYMDYADYAVLVVEAEPSSEDVSYVPWVYSGNLVNDTEKYTDEIIRYDLINYKSKAMLGAAPIYVIPWDTEFTLCAATVNDNLECGKVYRELMTLKKEDARPADEFEYMYDFPMFPYMDFGPEAIQSPDYAPAANTHKAISRTSSDKKADKEYPSENIVKVQSDAVRFAKKMVKERLF